MVIVCVDVHVKPERLEAFREATIENARQSLREPGVARFDVLQNAEQPERFVLVEVYRDADAPARHKQTSHYQKWRDTVAEMMVEPRRGTPYANVFPGEHGFDAARQE
jgi:autoinducer 2-degrading protein